MSHDHHHEHDHDHKNRHDHHTHQHSHVHEHAHEHDHTHDHHHHGEELSFDKKLTIIMGHWIDHNKSHQATYESWADKASKENQPDVAELLKEISKDSTLITQKLEKALQAIKQ